MSEKLFGTQIAKARETARTFRRRRAMSRRLEDAANRLTLVELADLEAPTMTDIIATLGEYVDSSAAVSGKLLTDTIERSNANQYELQMIQDLAVRGIVQQARHPFGCTDKTVRSEQSEYAHVIGYVGLKLADLAEAN